MPTEHKDDEEGKNDQPGDRIVKEVVVKDVSKAGQGEEGEGKEDNPEEKSSVEDSPKAGGANPEEEKKQEQDDSPPKNIFGERRNTNEDEYGMPIDPDVRQQQDYIKSHEPQTELEMALTEDLNRKNAHIERLTAEVLKLKNFISKRKQTYKRKRKESAAPTRALSAYNIFVQERFKRLSKENEVALKSADTDAQLKRVPPASLVASTGNQWKELSAEDKQHYEEKAKADRKRYQEQMASYHPPEKTGARKRNKTGYNMFFSQHVLRLKQTEGGVPSERGSVARLVGGAWKQLSPEEKQYYEHEADRNNQENPVEKTDGEHEGSEGRGKMPKAPKVHPPPGSGMPPSVPPPSAPTGGYPPAEYTMQHQPGAAGQGGAPDHGQYGRGDMYGQYSMYGPPPQAAYGGYPTHGQADAYSYPPHYGYSQHGYGHYNDGNPGGV